MNRPLRHLAASVFVAFALLVGMVTYWQVIAGPSLREDPRNARLAADRAGRERGGIITADGVVVARSDRNPDDPLLFSREYPEGPLYAHVAGYATLLFGQTGVEEAASAELSSGRDATISGILIALTGGDLRPQGVRLTIDHRVQRAAAEALGDRRGAVVAIDPATGAVRALVSSPSFDPNDLLGPTAGPVGDGLADDPGRPLLNRAIGTTYAPGSTFKVITAAAALETGIAGPETTFPDPIELALPGSTATIRNFNRATCAGGGQVSLAVAFARSCNTIFGTIGLELGAGDLVGAAERFGFRDPVPLELDAVASVIPPADRLASDLPAVAQSAIGQRDVRATPLGMALVAAGVANGGEIMAPYLIAETFNADGEITDATDPSLWQRAVSPATAGVLEDLMVRVVTNGTGGRADVAGLIVAGKTGTAEVPDSPPDLWFIGFARPETSPDRSLAVAVLVEAGGEIGEDATGGTLAAPIAAEVFAAWAESLAG